MMLDADAALRAAETLDDWMFYAEGHRRLFRVMIAIARRGGAIDPITLKEELERKGELEGAGGVDYLGYLLDFVPPRELRLPRQDRPRQGAAPRLIEVARRSSRTPTTAAAWRPRSRPGERKIFQVAEERTTEGSSA